MRQRWGNGLIQLLLGSEWCKVCSSTWSSSTWSCRYPLWNILHKTSIHIYDYLSFALKRRLSLRQSILASKWSNYGCHWLALLTADCRTLSMISNEYYKSKRQLVVFILAWGNTKNGLKYGRRMSRMHCDIRVNSKKGKDAESHSGRFLITDCKIRGVARILKGGRFLKNLRFSQSISNIFPQRVS
jgi:hypothetical protein